MACSRLWRRVANQIAPSYPDVTMEFQYVDSMAMLLIQQPRYYDVVVTSNLFGDILSDEAAVLTASLGMLPSATLPLVQESKGPGLFEPVHGSAPTIAGKNCANPIASILSLAMLLRDGLELPHEAELVERAVSEALDLGFRTRDLVLAEEIGKST